MSELTPPPTHKRKKSGPRPSGLNNLLPVVEPEQDLRPMSPMLALRTQLEKLEGGSEEHTKLQDFLQKKGQLLHGGQLDHDCFERLEKIYSGDGRTVWRVKHKGSDLVLCLKIIGVDAQPETLENILRELAVLHECHSTDIVAYYGSFFDESNQDVNIVMEYMDGGCLDDIQRRYGHMREDILSYACAKILRGLQYLDSMHHVIHRDVKPSNVVVNTQGEVKLCDFGVSRKLLSTRANTFVGTMRYMSPERIQGQAYNIKSDIWSLGLALIEMATGYYPFPKPEGEPRVPLRDPAVDPPLPSKAKTGSKMAIFDMVAMVVKGEPPKLPQGLFSVEFEDFVNKCLLKDTEERADLSDLLAHPWITGCKTTKEQVAQYVKASLPPQQGSTPEAVGDMFDLMALGKPAKPTTHGKAVSGQVFTL